MTKLLLVEDDFALRDIYSAQFTAEGYVVATASDGEEALAVAVREKPDLIILDVMMPKISGFDVLDILRQTPETKETHVIMMTALSQETDRQRGEALGVDKYLIKSQVTLDDVVATVKSVVDVTPAEPAAPADGAPVETTDAPAADATIQPEVPAAEPEATPPAESSPAPQAAPAEPSLDATAPPAPPTPGTVITPQQKQ